jgi:hypothetical protein
MLANVCFGAMTRRHPIPAWSVDVFGAVGRCPIGCPAIAIGRSAITIALPPPRRIDAGPGE